MLRFWKIACLAVFAAVALAACAASEKTANGTAPTAAKPAAPAAQPTAQPVAQPVAATDAAIGEGAKTTKLKNADGSTFTVADVPGKVKVVNFWATWCAPCIGEMPLLNAMSKKYAEKGVTFVAISMDETGPAAAEPRLKAGKPKIDFRVGYGLESDVAGLGVAFPIPDTLVFDASNNLVEHFDKVVEQKELEDAIAKALAGSAK